MFNAKGDDDCLILNDEDCSFFDFCERNKLIIEVTHKVGNVLTRIDGYLTAFHRKKSILTIKGRQGYDFVIPLKNIVSLTIKGKL